MNCFDKFELFDKYIHPWTTPNRENILITLVTLCFLQLMLDILRKNTILITTNIEISFSSPERYVMESFYLESKFFHSVSIHVVMCTSTLSSSPILLYEYITLFLSILLLMDICYVTVLLFLGINLPWTVWEFL